MANPDPAGVFKLGRFGRLAACAGAALVLGPVLYIGLVHVGVLRDPRAPAVVGDLASARSADPGLRVLFVGNSFTSHNAMPQLVKRLAERDPGAPTIVPTPFARELHGRIAAGGAETFLFMTWAYAEGDEDRPRDTFTAMQARVADSYVELGKDLHAAIAPVGLAWEEARRRAPGLDLWGRDGSHPSEKGSYLAACVLYAVLTGRDPTGSRFPAGLDEDEARFLQRVAADVVANR